MAGNGQETEVKFYVLHLDRIRMRLEELNAGVKQTRVLETNLRFDLPDGSLRARGQVLRLRRDTESRLTYKGAGQNTDGVLGRKEIEFVVDDFDKARQFLEALGYQQSLVYEKYRATYELNDVWVMLDELPYGNFVEIEGDTNEQIKAVSTRLGLDWSAAVGISYTGLFETLRTALQIPFRDILFKNFKDTHVTANQLGVRAADG